MSDTEPMRGAAPLPNDPRALMEMLRPMAMTLVKEFDQMANKDIPEIKAALREIYLKLEAMEKEIRAQK